MEDRKEILGKTENELEKGTGNVIEIDSIALKQAIRRMKNGRAAGPADISVELIKSGGHAIRLYYHIS